MSLPRTLLKRGAAIFSTVAITLLLLSARGLLLGIVYTYALIYAAIRFTLEYLYIVLDPRIRY